MKKLTLLVAAIGMVLSACGGGGTTTTGGTGEEIPPELQELVTAAQAEGTINTIALPRDWCNYGGVIDRFVEKYGLTYNGLAPDAGSADELEAIRANKDNPGPAAPDVVDIGLGFAPTAKEEGLLQPYQVLTWDTIPEDAKDPEGYWYGDYYGVLAFEVNTDVVETVPQDWADLLNPDYNGQIALAGDPRVSAQAVQSVLAAGLATGGSLDDPAGAAQAGLEFWAQVADAGNLVPVIAESGTVASGETPVTIRWTYNGLSNRDQNADIAAIEVVVPASGRYAGVYVQGISAYAPQPSAAKLWMEFLYSDEGQNLWLEGYCHPIRYEDMVERGVVPQERLDALPDVEGAVFPTLEQIEAASEAITTQWDSVVGVNIGG
ncbi:MAG TPA: extracellular solute-binding protein [Acidimicrobiia bacterium]|nr:extracellular solute-binding protein [Acidimicrobiia bacterium]